MPGFHRRRQQNGLDAWPGYVDALSTLLMVTIFVLLVFVLAQGLLSVTLSGKDKALERLNQQIAQLTDMLSLERGRAADLQNNVASLAHDLGEVSSAARRPLEAVLRGREPARTGHRPGLRPDGGAQATAERVSSPTAASPGAVRYRAAERIAD